jgi:aminopeptidase N
VDRGKRGLQRYFGSPGEEHALAATDFASPRYSQVAYAKGAFAVRTLRAWLGAEAFASGMRAYLDGAAQRGGAATLDDFLAAFRAQDGASVDAWDADWLRRPGVPRYTVELTGEKAGKLVQSGELYRNPVELALHLGGAKTHTITVRPTQLVEPWTADVGGKIEWVEIDPRHLVLFDRPR